MLFCLQICVGLVDYCHQDIWYLVLLGVDPAGYFGSSQSPETKGDSSESGLGTADDEEGDMRRRGARECEEALMEAAEARRGYTRVAAWDEGNMIQAMARLKNPTIAWRYGDG